MMLRLRTQLRFYCTDGSEFNCLQMNFQSIAADMFECKTQLQNCQRVALLLSPSLDTCGIDASWTYEIYAKSNNAWTKVGPLNTTSYALDPMTCVPINTPTTYGLKLIKKEYNTQLPETIKANDDSYNGFYNLAYGKQTMYSHVPQRQVQGHHEWSPPIKSTDVGTNKNLPWIDVFVGGGSGPVFCSRIQLKLLPIPLPNAPRRMIRVRLRSYGVEEHNNASWSATAIEDEQGCVQFLGLKQAGRVLRIEIVADTLFSGAVTTLQLRDVDVTGAPIWGNTLLATYRRAFSFHKDRRAFGTRKPLSSSSSSSSSAASIPPFRWLTYHQIWNRALNFSRGLTARLSTMTASTTVDVTTGGIAIMARNSEEWVIARLACLMLGRLCIGVAYNLDSNQLLSVLNQGQAIALVCDSSSLSSIVECSTMHSTSSVQLLVHINANGNDNSNTSSFTNFSWCPVESFESVETTSSSSSSLLPNNTKPITTLRSSSGRMVSDREDRGSLMLFTSGSSGTPKGVTRSFKQQHILLRGYGVPQVASHLSIQPLSHLSESCILPGILFMGGQIGFPTYHGTGGGLDLFQDLRAISPTFMFSVPRFFEIIMALFRETVKTFSTSNSSDCNSSNDGYQPALDLFRSVNGPLGHRCTSVSVGSAPVTPALFTFLNQVFSTEHGGTAHVSRGYGSTECGTVAMNGKVFYSARVFLVEIKEEGLLLEGNKPRGEILIHTDKCISKYGTGALSGVVVQGYPYFRPGDACETDKASYDDGEWHGVFNNDWGSDLNGRKGVLLKTGHVLEVVGRTKNVVKLSNGEFVSPETIEKKLDGASALVDQLVIVVDEPRSGVVALVVPSDLALVGNEQVEQQVLHCFQQVSSLLQFERPLRVAVVGHKWTADRGTMTSSNKLDRKGIAKECRTALLRIGCNVTTGLSTTTTGGASKTSDKPPSPQRRELLDRVCDLLCEPSLVVAKSYVPEMQHEHDFLQHLGLDSLQAALLGGKLELRNIPGISVLVLMQQSIFQTWASIHNSGGSSKSSSGSHGVGTQRKSNEYWFNETTGTTTTGRTTTGTTTTGSTTTASTLRLNSTPASFVLLTGVTGYIGPHLLEAVVTNGRWSHVVCIVRPPLDRVIVPSFGLYNVHVELIPGDISRPDLGISSEAWRYLSGIPFDTVVHSAALVNHIRTYEQMKPHNVTACDDLIRLVSSCSLPPAFLFVSTVSAVGPHAKEDLESTPPTAVNGLGSGYGQSKWVAERRLAAAAKQGHVRHLSIVRLGLIGPHSMYGQMTNYQDWLHLFVKSCCALQVRPQMEPKTSMIEVLPVDLTVRLMSSLASLSAASSVAAHAGNQTFSHNNNINVVQLDGRAAGMKPMNVLLLLDRLAREKKSATWSSPLTFPQWCARARQVGGAPLVALSVMPGPRHFTDVVYRLPDPTTDSLVRGNVVKTLMENISVNGGKVLECYEGEEFLKAWSKGVMKNVEEGGRK